MGKTRGNCKDLWEGLRKSMSSFQDPTSVLPYSWQIWVSLSLSPTFCCFCWEICPLSGYHALSEHLPPSGLSSGNRWGRRPFPCPSKLLKAAHWEPTSTPRPSRKPPTPGKAPTPRTHISLKEQTLLIYLLYLLYMSQCFLSISLWFEGGWVTQCYALLHRGGGSALSHTASQGTGEEDSARRMTPADALQSNILASRQ